MPDDILLSIILIVISIIYLFMYVYREKLMKMKKK